MADKTILEKQIISHEGLEKHPYTDSVGKLTIGVGRNLTDRGISEEEALYLMRNDLRQCDTELRIFNFYKKLDSVRKGALIELCYNLGLPRLLTFKKMLAALCEHDYKAASYELLDSKWSRDVGKARSENIANRLYNGTYKSN